MSAAPADLDFLAGMAQSSRARVVRARALRDDAALQALARSRPEPPALQLSPEGFDLIAEVKRRSPAVGQLDAGGEDIGARARDYAHAGAAAISVLTEPTRFDGELEHLAQVVEALEGRVPAMRKDFLVDPYQVYEARAAGAGGVLVILRMLEPQAVTALLNAAAQSGMFVLLEAFDEVDLDFAAALVSGLCGAPAAARRRQLPRPDHVAGSARPARGAGAAAAAVIFRAWPRAVSRTAPTRDDSRPRAMDSRWSAARSCAPRTG